MGCKYAYLLPPIFGLFMIVVILITYTWSTLTQHVIKFFPYISDTGSWPPESCFFSFAFFIGSTAMAVIVYLRYRQVRLFTEVPQMEVKISLLKTLNTVSLWLGFVACLGMLIVGSFQETAVFWVHLLGATLTYGGGCAYMWFQVVLSAKMLSKCARKTLVLRIIFIVICTITFLCFQTTAVLASLEFTGDNLTLWSKKDGGFEFHLTSTMTEWILTVLMILFFVTYTGEFKKLDVSEPVVTEIKDLT